MHYQDEIKKLMQIDCGGYMPFLTGSHIYGVTHEGSDIDIVLRVDKETTDRLAEIAPDFLTSNISGDYGRYSVCFKFGDLNVICCLSDAMFEAWQEATTKCLAAMLKARKGITRDEAVKIHSECRVRHGVQKPEFDV